MVTRMDTTERMLSIGELARSTGMTRRALRHYDAIGLLVPAHRTEGGYRRVAPSIAAR
jgi:hypothetical protein